MLIQLIISTEQRVLRGSSWNLQLKNLNLRVPSRDSRRNDQQWCSHQISNGQSIWLKKRLIGQSIQRRLERVRNSEFRSGTCTGQMEANWMPDFENLEKMPEKRLPNEFLRQAWLPSGDRTYFWKRMHFLESFNVLNDSLRDFQQTIS